MKSTVDEEIQRHGRISESWTGDEFQYQLICANTKDVMEKYDQALHAAMRDMTQRRANGEVIVSGHQIRLLQDSIEDFGCDTMTVVLFSWAHTSKEEKQFQPKKPQHLKVWRSGRECSVNVQGYHLELTSTVLGLRPRDKDFHTLLN
eukprot:183155-Amphidinium_carterae.1